MLNKDIKYSLSFICEFIYSHNTFIREASYAVFLKYNMIRITHHCKIICEYNALETFKFFRCYYLIKKDAEILIHYLNHCLQVQQKD